MPHSSGGGSHGGGHHGGGHSSRSGGSSRHVPRVSTTRFYGARRYSYLDKNNVKQYIYCAEDPAKAFKPQWALLIIYVPFIIAFFAMASNIVHIPRKVDNLDSHVIIEDKANVVENATELSRALTDFYYDTGVTPAVITGYNEDWQGNYADLEKYAYDLYVNRFQDEKHWLVVYTIPKRQRSDGFVDWFWEGMIGDDVGSMITSRNESFFTAEMHQNLSTSRTKTIDNAVATTFADTAKEAGRISIDFEMIPAVLVFLAFITFHAIGMVGISPKNLRYSKAKLDPDPRDMPVRCEYCGSSFILNDHVSCPNCGAPIEHKQTAAAAAMSLLGKDPTTL